MQYPLILYDGLTLLHKGLALSVEALEKPQIRRGGDGRLQHIIQ